MSEETKARMSAAVSAVGKAAGATVKSTKHTIWKYFGAMFMEKKDGVQAVSLTRLLSLVCFGMLLWKWGYASETPETLLYTFWGLVGGKTAESVVGRWKGAKAG